MAFPTRPALALLCLLTTFAPARADILAEDTPADAVPTALGAFAFDLYREVAASQPGKNVFCSPYSLSNALAMCAEGATDDTAREMGKALRLPTAWDRSNTKLNGRPWDLDPLHTGIAALNKRYNAANAGYEMRVANALWVDKTCLLQKPYLDAITRHYRGGVYGVDFHNDPRASCRLINAWAKQQTRGRIPEILPEDSRLSHLVITNAVHFAADWASAFEADKTKDADFVPGDGKPVQVKTMHRESAANVRYGAFEGNGIAFATPAELSFGKEQALYPDAKGFCVLEMPYKGGEMSMVLLVPRSPSGLGAVEKLLSPANLTAWLAKLEKREVHVHVPRFTMESDYDLAKPLQAMGMKRAFVEPGTDGAQFGGLVVADKPRDKVFITRVIHKAFVQVNEQGTKASAATAVASARSIGGPFTPAFKADRSFVFLIRDTKSGTILFLGRVCDPRTKG